VQGFPEFGVGEKVEGAEMGRDEVRGAHAEKPYPLIDGDLHPGKKTGGLRS
jgi:hypothetical protein